MNRIEKLRQYFTPAQGWELVVLKPGDVAVRATVPGSPIRCIDRRFGVTEKGYDPNAVPPGPAWMGAFDGIETFSRRTNPLARAKEAANKVRALGFEPADHGDYTVGADGCAYRRARRAGLLPGVSAAYSERVDNFIKQKVGAIHMVVREAAYHARGFVLNGVEKTTVLPDDGKYYINDEWFAQLAGIKPELYLPVIAACGELILPQEDRKLFVL